MISALDIYFFFFLSGYQNNFTVFESVTTVASQCLTTTTIAGTNNSVILPNVVGNRERFNKCFQFKRCLFSLIL